uniref:Uncharacterized protein n=1 Tax=Tetranychus urticae TaxID=32264 RepID=T1KTL8_TETUR
MNGALIDLMMSPKVCKRKQLIVVLNKIDLLPESTRSEAIEKVGR